MTSRLDLIEEHDGFAIAWVEDGDEGARVGQDLMQSEGQLEMRMKAATDKDTREYYAVELAALRFVGRPKAEHRGNVAYSKKICGLGFESRQDAQGFLRVAREARRRAHDNVPLPWWAEKAIAVGFKPPKGWKP